MIQLQNIAPYNVWQHDDQGSSTSIQTTCLIVWGGKHLTVQANSSTALKSWKTRIVTDQILWHWVAGHQVAANWILWDFWQMFHHKRKELSNLQAGSQCSRPEYIYSSLKAYCMAFCCCFQPPSTAFSTEGRVSGKSSWISCKEGKPWVYHFLLFIPTTLLQQFKHILYIALWLISRQK